MSFFWSALPPELQLRIIDEIDERTDLLALALTCRALHRTITPAHLALHDLILSRTHTGLWTDALQPNLATRVRALTLVNTEVAAPCARAAYGTPMPAVGRKQSERKGAVDALVARVRALPRLRAFALQGGYCGQFQFNLKVVEEMLEPHVDSLRCLSLDLHGFVYSHLLIVCVSFG